MRKPPRLIDDKRKKGLFYAMGIMALIAVLAGACLLTVAVINEKRRMNGRNLLATLKEKQNWLEVKMNPPRDVKDLEAFVPSIGKYLETKANITLDGIDITADRVDFVASTRKKDPNSDASNLAKSCREILEKLSDQRKNLTVLSNKPTDMATQMRDAATSETGKEIASFCTRTEDVKQVMTRLCKRPIVLTKEFLEGEKSCREIITQLETNQNYDAAWSQFEKMHDNYNAWKNSVLLGMQQCDDLEKELKATFQKLKNLPLSRENTIDNTKNLISDELYYMEPLMKKGVDLYTSYPGRLEEELNKHLSTATEACTTISNLQEKHGGSFIDAAKVTAIMNSKANLETIREKSLKDVGQRCRALRDFITNLRSTLSKAGETYTTLDSFDENVDDSLLQQKCQEGMDCASNLKKLRPELGTKIDQVKNAIAEAQASAKKIAEEITKEVNNLQLNLPDLNAENLRISQDFNNLKKQVEQLKNDLGNKQRLFENKAGYDYRYQAERDRLRTKHNQIMRELENIQQKCNSIRPCTNGKELDELIKLRDELKKQLENANKEIEALYQNQSDYQQVSQNFAAIKQQVEELKDRLNTMQRSFENNHPYSYQEVRWIRNTYEQILKTLDNIQKKCSYSTSDKGIGELAKQRIELKNQVDTAIQDIATLSRQQTEYSRLSLESTQIKQQIIRQKDELEKIRKSFDGYRNNSYQSELASLQNKYNQILYELNYIQTIFQPISSDKSGNAFLEQMKGQNTTVKRRLDTAALDITALNNRLENSVRTGVLRKLDYVSYINLPQNELLASKLKRGTRQFNFALDIPQSGSHKIEIIFRKNVWSLFKMKGFFTSHIVVIDCAISANRINKRQQIRCEDLTNKRWDYSTKGWNPIELNGYFNAGRTDIDLELSIWAEDDERNRLDSGLTDPLWQFQVKNVDNISIEVWLDGKAQNLLVRKQTY